MSVKDIEELLAKQKLVEGMVHGQRTPRQEMVERVVHRQHLTEVGQLIERMSAEEIGAVLEGRPLEDARMIWAQIPERRQNDVLWEVSDELREQLASGMEPGFADSRMSAYERVDGRLREVAITVRQNLAGTRPIWIDLIHASKPERNYVGRYFGLVLPDPGEATDLEVSSRFQMAENGDLRLHSNFLLDRDGDSRSVPVVFILHDGVLFTLRNEELPVFRLQRRRALTQPGYVSDGHALLLDLYGADVEYSADALEGIYAKLDSVGRTVLGEAMSDADAATILASITEEENRNGRIRGNILDTQRALSFLMRGRALPAAHGDVARQILRDIDSLNSHTAFLFDKINFLMDATIGFININQNKRVTQLTVFGAVVMPLNIIAGIGGMSEYSALTEHLPMPIAYGLLVLGMGLLGWITYQAVLRIQSDGRPRRGKAKSLAAEPASELRNGR
jgi:magnesium transporter